jgi:hypothetical protein
MRTFLSIAFVLLMVACKPHNPPTGDQPLPWDSIYTFAVIEHHGDYYNSGHQVHTFDLLSNGLQFNSEGYIVGSGFNLCITDIFTPYDSTIHIPSGEYHMDSTAINMTFLRGMYFEGNVTGSYLLEIKDSQIQSITLFTAGTMNIDFAEGDTIVDFSLYTADSTHYSATYIGHTKR